jgi:membrane protease YdiL (CAAX protease family)
VSLVRRRSGLVLLATLVAAAWLTRVAYVAAPRTRWPVVALVLVLLDGSVLSGGMPAGHRRGRHPVVRPLLAALLLFAVFALAGFFARLVPAVDHGVEAVVRHAEGDGLWWAAFAAGVAGVAEEVFYRGALLERVRLPVLTATAAHVLATLPTGNVALAGAAALLGLACGVSRRASGGWWAPAVTHAAWSVLMLTFTR